MSERSYFPLKKEKLAVHCVGIMVAIFSSTSAGSWEFFLHAAHCEREFMCSVDCGSIAKGGFWHPTVESRPAIAPGDALKIAKESIKSHPHFTGAKSIEPDSLRIFRCGEGWLVLVSLLVSSDCPCFLGAGGQTGSVAVAVLMDGSVFLPEMSHSEEEQDLKPCVLIAPGRDAEN